MSPQLAVKARLTFLDWALYFAKLSKRTSTQPGCLLAAGDNLEQTEDEEDDVETRVVTITRPCQQRGKGASRAKSSAGKGKAPVQIKQEPADEEEVQREGDQESVWATETEQEGSDNQENINPQQPETGTRRGRPKGSKTRRGKRSDIGRKSKQSRKSERHLTENRGARNEIVAQSNRNRRDDEETRQEEQALDTARRQQRRDSTQFVDRENQNQMERRSRRPRSHLEARRVDHEHFRETVHFDSIAQPSDVGRQETECPHCHALLFPAETSGNRQTPCCGSGKITLPIYQDPPEPLKSLYDRSHPKSEEFLRHARAYNDCFAMASMASEQVRYDRPPFVFKVHGRMAERVGRAMLPRQGQAPRYMQLYFVGPGQHEQADERMRQFEHLDQELVMDLQEMLHQHNPYVRRLKFLMELPDVEQGKVVIHSARKRPAGSHQRQYNAPATQEVAAIIGESEEPLSKQDLVLHLRQPDERGRLVQFTPVTHVSYDALHYTLIHARGEDGFDLGQTEQQERDKVSTQAFYRYQMQIRRGKTNHLVKGRFLSQQLATDVYARVTKRRFDWARKHQRELRAEKYVVVVDGTRRDAGLHELGAKVILPPTIVGSPR